MGTHSTANITRSSARKFLVENAEIFDDKTLGLLLGVVFDKSLINCRIVNDDDPEANEINDWPA